MWLIQGGDWGYGIATPSCHSDGLGRGCLQLLSVTLHGPADEDSSAPLARCSACFDDSTQTCRKRHVGTALNFIFRLRRLCCFTTAARSVSVSVERARQSSRANVLEMLQVKPFTVNFVTKPACDTMRRLLGVQWLVCRYASFAVFEQPLRQEQMMYEESPSREHSSLRLRFLGIACLTTTPS